MMRGRMIHVELGYELPECVGHVLNCRMRMDWKHMEEYKVKISISKEIPIKNSEYLIEHDEQGRHKFDLEDSLRYIIHYYITATTNAMANLNGIGNGTAHFDTTDRLSDSVLHNVV